jgi:DNA-directed RNA polymerase subunit RPC12/RpoP
MLNLESSEHREHHGSAPCRVCSSSVDPEHAAARLGICPHCGYKILIFVVVVMVAISYTLWFGLLY